MTPNRSTAGRRHALRVLSTCLTVMTAGALSAAALTSAEARAESAFPDKVVRIVVPNPAGGASDVVARLIAQRLSDDWKQPVIVENRAGAAGNIGASLVAKAQPDGYTLLLMDATSLAISPTLYPNLNYDPHQDLTPVSIVAYSPHILVVKNDLPVKTLPELAEYARAHPGKLNFGQTPGSITHLAGALLAQKQDFKWNYIGYKGGSQVLTDLAGGQIDAAMNSFLATYPMVKSGNIKMLAVASPTRFSQIPDTPTMAETVSGFETGSWQGLFATGGTPAHIVQKIHDDVQRITATPEVQKRLADLGSERKDLSPEAIRTWMKEQTEYWGRVVKENDIKLM